MPWVVAALSITNFAALVKNMLSAGEKKLEKRLIKAEGTLITHDRRVQTIEGELRHFPDRNSVHQLQIGMEKMSGRLDTLNESLKPIKANGELLNELLMEQAKK